MPKGHPGRLPCSVEDCGRLTTARGMCVKHYGNWRRTGVAVIPKPPLDERFWAKVGISAEDRCWEWSGNRNPKGYGSFSPYWPPVRGATKIAHRWAWMLANGTEVPDGLLVLHRCDNPPCCNPGHLWLGTAADNSADMVLKGRSHTGRKQVTHAS